MNVVDLTTVSSRNRLKPSVEPHYMKLMHGCFLGFRKTAIDSAGTWSARYTNAETGKQHKTTFGGFDERVPSERYGAAKEAAEAWFKHLGAGGRAEIVNVKKACEDYVKHVRSFKGEKKGDEVKARFERWVYADTLARVELPKLTRTSLESWRKRVMATPVVVNPHAENRITRPRTLATLNRDMAALRAALNYAHDHGHVTSDLAWRVALKAASGTTASGRRDLYLDRGQRKALVDHASEEFRPFLTGFAQLPLRPGALAALKVGQFDERLRVLTVGKDKAGMDRRLTLPDSLVAFFSKVAKDQKADAPLFPQPNGKPWHKDVWKKAIKEAVAAAELPAATVAYTLRHSVLTDLVVSGLDLLTVAQLSGTSVEMIEAHYGHLQAARSVQALATLAL